MQLGYFSRDIYLSSRGHQRGAAWCWRAGCGTWAPPTIINYCLHNFNMSPPCPRLSQSHTRDNFPRFPSFGLLRGANVLQFVDLKLSKVHHFDPRHVSNVWRSLGGEEGASRNLLQILYSPFRTGSNIAYMFVRTTAAEEGEVSKSAASLFQSIGVRS